MFSSSTASRFIMFDVQPSSGFALLSFLLFFFLCFVAPLSSPLTPSVARSGKGQANVQANNEPYEARCSVSWHFWSAPLSSDHNSGLLFVWPCGLAPPLPFLTLPSNSHTQLPLWRLQGE